MSTSAHACWVRSSVVPLPSGWRNTGAVAAPIADRTSMLIIAVVLWLASDAVNSNVCGPTSAGIGVHRNTPAPLGDTVMSAWPSRSVRSAERNL